MFLFAEVMKFIPDKKATDKKISLEDKKQPVQAVSGILYSTTIYIFLSEKTMDRFLWYEWKYLSVLLDNAGLFFSTKLYEMMFKDYGIL